MDYGTRLSAVADRTRLRATSAMAVQSNDVGLENSPSIVDPLVNTQERHYWQEQQQHPLGQFYPLSSAPAPGHVNSLYSLGKKHDPEEEGSSHLYISDGIDTTELIHQSNNLYILKFFAIVVSMFEFCQLASLLPTMLFLNMNTELYGLTIGMYIIGKCIPWGVCGIYYYYYNRRNYPINTATTTSSVSSTATAVLSLKTLFLISFIFAAAGLCFSIFSLSHLDPSSIPHSHPTDASHGNMYIWWCSRLLFGVSAATAQCASYHYAATVISPTHIVPVMNNLIGYTNSGTYQLGVLISLIFLSIPLAQTMDTDFLLNTGAVFNAFTIPPLFVVLLLGSCFCAACLYFYEPEALVVEQEPGSELESGSEVGPHVVEQGTSTCTTAAASGAGGAGSTSFGREMAAAPLFNIGTPALAIAPAALQFRDILVVCDDIKGKRGRKQIHSSGSNDNGSHGNGNSWSVGGRILDKTPLSDVDTTVTRLHSSPSLSRVLLTPSAHHHQQQQQQLSTAGGNGVGAEAMRKKELQRRAAAEAQPGSAGFSADTDTGTCTDTGFGIDTGTDADTMNNSNGDVGGSEFMLAVTDAASTALTNGKSKSKSKSKVKSATETLIEQREWHHVIHVLALGTIISLLWMLPYLALALSQTEQLLAVRVHNILVHKAMTPQGEYPNYPAGHFESGKNNNSIMNKQDVSAGASYYHYNHYYSSSSISPSLPSSSPADISPDIPSAFIERPQDMWQVFAGFVLGQIFTRVLSSKCCCAWWYRYRITQCHYYSVISVFVGLACALLSALFLVIVAAQCQQFSDGPAYAKTWQSQNLSLSVASTSSTSYSNEDGNSTAVINNNTLNDGGNRDNNGSLFSRLQDAQLQLTHMVHLFIASTVILGFGLSWFVGSHLKILMMQLENNSIKIRSFSEGVFLELWYMNSADMLCSHLLLPLIACSIVYVDGTDNCDVGDNTDTSTNTGTPNSAFITTVSEDICCFRQQVSGSTSFYSKYSLQGCRFVALVPIISCLFVLACTTMATAVYYYTIIRPNLVNEKDVDERCGGNGGDISVVGGGNGFGIGNEFGGPHRSRSRSYDVSDGRVRDDVVSIGDIDVR